MARNGDSPSMERQTKFRNRVLSTNLVDPLDLKKAQSLRTPLLVKVKESGVGSECSSPLSSSSNDADTAFTLPAKRIISPIDGAHMRKSSSLASLISSKEDVPLSIRQHSHFLAMDQVLTAPVLPVSLLSVPRGSPEVSLPKSRSLVCLAVATMAQMAGHPLNVTDAR